MGYLRDLLWQFACCSGLFASGKNPESGRKCLKAWMWQEKVIWIFSLVYIFRKFPVLFIIKMSSKRAAIIELYKQGQGVNNIARLLKMHKQSVIRAVSRFKELGTLEDRPRSGRPPDVRVQKAKKAIKAKLRRNPKRSMRMLAKEGEISNRTVRRLVNDELRKQSLKLQETTALTEEHKEERLKRCKRLLRLFTECRHREILFSDESYFLLQEGFSKQNTRIIAATREEANAYGRLVERSQFPKTLMVWGGICWNGKTPLVIFEPRENVNVKNYKEKPFHSRHFPREPTVIGPMALSSVLLQISFILAILHSLALCQNPENGAAALVSPGNHEPENGTTVTPDGSAKEVSEEDRKAFQDYLRDFKKTYSEENGEFGRRLAVFAQTRRRVAKMHSEGMKWAGITQFADMSTEERKQMLMSGDAVTKMEDSASPDVARMPVIESRGRTKRQTPPSSFDYRTYGWVTPVKHQGSCGSCWAFSTVELMETVYLKYWNNLNDLSEQDLVDCATGNLGCDGGNVESALYYISQNRTTHEVYYPYQGVKQTCNRAISKNVMATRYFRLTNESSIAYFNYHNGPVSFIFTVKSDFFDYVSGVYDASECSDTSATFEGWHYMVIVGFTPSYWIAKNSWGTGWGNFLAGN
ncbi:papain family cysteine protease domain-containing protein [Ditylenchus destructor]|uniref:Papain family cysteine protease domain-containing protein n=1 Tax=Ditylenchus destructor TaxID=166010 RepID=A0AAD4MJ20_9BILA|nr:papain family cysteine protease domain-containing protein [Ditylenchus destructor]